MRDYDLLVDFISAYPAQPATAFWRAIEIGALAEVGLPQGRGLDLGCGDGKLTAIVLGLVGERRLVGVDPDPLECEAARRFGFYEAVHAVSAAAIPEPDASFDFVLSNSVLEHIPDLGPILAEVGRLLRPGGEFFFTVPAPGFHRNLGGALLPGASREDYLARLDRRLAHFHYQSPDEWRAACAAHGLEVSDILGFLDARETRRWESLSRVTGGLLYAVFGNTARPIEIQRKLGARALQNAVSLPRPAARALASGVAMGIPDKDEAHLWAPLEEASCFLVRGRRL
jgi:SAM-dependent methyltransferase